MMGQAQQKQVKVTVSMLDGSVLLGDMVCGLTGNIELALNREAPFLEIIGLDGTRRFVAKHQIASIEPTERPVKPVLDSPTANNDDVFSILGLSRECTLQEAKDAYHRLAKSYHPDRWSAQEMPSEILRYVSDMFRQINIAFTTLRDLRRTAA